MRFNCQINSWKHSEQERLETQLKLKTGAHVLLTCNINIGITLVNGLVGKVMRTGHKRNTVKVTYVNFDDQNADLATMQFDITAQQVHLVPIQKCEVSLPIKKKQAKPFY